MKLIYAVVIGLFALEVALRLGVGFGNPILVIPDPYAGYILKPKQRVNRFFVNTRINQYGMRSDEIDISNARKTSRILLLGDSILYGTTQVDQAYILANLVQTKISDRLKARVEVLNACAPAWAIGNELAFAESRGIFKSDVVALVINHGDIPQPFASISSVGDALQTRKPMFALEELGRALRIVLGRKKAKQDAGIDVLNEDSPQAKQNFQKISELRKISQRGDASFIVVYVPLRRELKLKQQHSMPASLSNYLESEHIDSIDMTWAESGTDTNLMVTRDGAHFNKLGNSVLAPALADALIHILDNRKHNSASLVAQK